MKDPNNILQKALSRNEPVFVLRAQDALSLAAISSYLHAASLVIESREQYSELKSIYDKFINWQYENKDKVKFPD